MKDFTESDRRRAEIEYRRTRPLGKMDREELMSEVITLRSELSNIRHLYITYRSMLFAVKGALIAANAIVAAPVLRSRSAVNRLADSVEDIDHPLATSEAPNPQDTGTEHR